VIALLQEWVTREAERRPEATALVTNGERLTYGQLDALSNQVARGLSASGCRRGDRVCLLLPKSSAAIVGILAALKADCVYVPLDTASPIPRLAQMMARCEPRAVLAAGSTARLVKELLADERLASGVCLGWLSEDAPPDMSSRATLTLADCQTHSSGPLPPQNSEDDPAYILFTSGSTGVPKGVVITHKNIRHFVEWGTEYFGIGPSDRMSGHSPLHFDLSTFDIFGTFAAGAELHPVPPELNLLPNQLAEFIRKEELTQWFSVPSALSYMAKFDVVAQDDFPSLKRILWCGEVLPTPVLTHWMKRLPAVTFTNLYGPTEATIASSYYTVPERPADERASIPIGTACPGEELLVLDEKLRPVEKGETGDLYIRGVGLASGYWRDPERTREVFLPDPSNPNGSERIYKTGDLARVGSDGLLYFLGRADSQIKSRGYRIELGEIETWLQAIPTLKESAVVAINTSGFESALICCAYAPVRPGQVRPADVRRDLAKVLPSYMLPARWMALEALPKNANGKIDRRRLAEEFGRHGA
jgi:amino acid adenylation domain-containing protein